MMDISFICSVYKSLTHIVNIPTQFCLCLIYHTALTNWSLARGFSYFSYFAPPISAGNANSKRQCYFLIVSQFFLLPEPPAPPTLPRLSDCCVGKSDPTSPHLPSLSTSPSLRPLCSVHTCISCVRVCVCVCVCVCVGMCVSACVFDRNGVFVCREMMRYPVSDLLSSSPLSPKAEILCVYACRMLSDLLSYFHCRWSLLFHTHTHTHTHTDTHTHTLGWKTLRIRLPHSALEGWKAPDRFTVSVVCCFVLLDLQLQESCGPGCPWKLKFDLCINQVKLKKNKKYTKTKSWVQMEITIPFILLL